VGTVGVSRDITDRKRVEEALKESERRLHDLSSHLLSAQEKERRRIALELHDDLGQELSVLKLQIGSIERKLKKIPTTLEEDCDTVLRSVDQIIENVRRLSHDLSPSILEDLGLSAAIRSLIEDFRKYGRINVSIDTEKIDNLFSNEAQIVIYRIFQEALSNIVKHAQATHVSIAMERNDESVAFVIEDNGKGYDPEKVQRRSSAERGLGIPAIIERVRMLGGTLNLSSHESRGTSICFTLPIDKEGSVH
jgi:signal transduction histidine kinase